MPEKSIVHHGGVVLGGNPDYPVVRLLSDLEGPRTTHLPGIRDGGSQNWPVSGVQLSIPYRSFPSCYLTLSPDFLKGGLVQQATERNINLLESYLYSLLFRLEGRENSRVIIYGNDAVNETLTASERKRNVSIFDGVINSYQVSTYAGAQVSVRLQLQHEYSLALSVDFGIYRQHPKFFLVDQGVFDTIEDEEDKAWELLRGTPDSVAALLYGTIVRTMAVAWQHETFYTGDGDEYFSLHQAQHALNKTLVSAYILKVLEASVESTRVVNMNFRYGCNDLKDWLQSALFEHPSLWQVVERILGAFYCYPVFPMTADTDRVPYFRRENFMVKTSKVWSFPKRITNASRRLVTGVPIIQVLVTDAEQSDLFLVGSYEEADKGTEENPPDYTKNRKYIDLMRYAADPLADGDTVIGRYPETIGAGTTEQERLKAAANALRDGMILPVTAPFWAARMNFTEPAEIPHGETPEERLASFDTWYAGIRGLPGISDAQIEEIEDARAAMDAEDYVLAESKFSVVSFAMTVLGNSYLQAILNWIAYMEFFRERYRGTSVGPLNTPLNPTFEVGERVTVQRDGEAFFTGFPTSVTHTIDLQGGNGVKSTGLTFDYVLYTTFFEGLSDFEKSLIEQAQNANTIGVGDAPSATP